MVDKARTRIEPLADDSPFRELPTELLDQLWPFLDELTEEVVRAIRTEIAHTPARWTRRTCTS